MRLFFGAGANVAKHPNSPRPPQSNRDHERRVSPAVHPRSASMASHQTEFSMLSKLLKSTAIAAVIGLAGIAAITPASARDFDYHGGYHRDRDSGWGRDHDR